MNRKTLFLLFLKDKSNFKLREQLITLHLPLVEQIVRRFKYYPRCLTRADLVQEGVLGFIKALTNYQDFGYDCLAYAKPHIKKVINEAIRVKSLNLPIYQIFQKIIMILLLHIL